MIGSVSVTCLTCSRMSALRMSAPAMSSTHQYSYDELVRLLLWLRYSFRVSTLNSKSKKYIEREKEKRIFNHASGSFRLTSLVKACRGVRREPWCRGLRGSFCRASRRFRLRGGSKGPAQAHPPNLSSSFPSSRLALRKSLCSQGSSDFISISFQKVWKLMLHVLPVNPDFLCENRYVLRFIWIHLQKHNSFQKQVLVLGLTWHCPRYLALPWSFFFFPPHFSFTKLLVISLSFSNSSFN